MLRSRVIPALLVQDGGLVKTTNFSNPKYVGDPINAVRIFNDLGVDELCVFDISATPKQRSPDFGLIERIANECKMPFCYGGGITTAEDFEKIVSLGVEKVAISSAALQSPEIITEAAKLVGSSSVVIVIDYKQSGFFSNKEQIFSHSGSKPWKFDLFDFCQKCENLGAGEIILNSIDRDGSCVGLDVNVIQKVFNNVSIPITALGGIGDFKDFLEISKICYPIGIAAGSYFVFQGKYKAVLISYLSAEQKDQLDMIHHEK